jgi:hypothetical protein
MSKSYIELASGFRNRLLYPNAADFVVNPCEINSENPLENSNNISDAYPFYNFWSLPLNIIKRIDAGYKPELVPMNYGIDSCNMHLTTKNIEGGGPAAQSLTNNLTACCVGTAAKPVFSNQILPIHTLSNMFDWKTEIDSCNEITSIYNKYAATGLIKQIDGQCCMSRYYDGMSMTNFTSSETSCKECSTITHQAMLPLCPQIDAVT